MSKELDPTLGYTDTPEKAGDKGSLILNKVVELYSLVEWAESHESGDPYVKLTLYKSGRMTLENHRDEDITEFRLNNEGELE